MVAESSENYFPSWEEFHHLHYSFNSERFKENYREDCFLSFLKLMEQVAMEAPINDCTCYSFLFNDN
jgi:hypothetical protein